MVTPTKTPPSPPKIEPTTLPVVPTTDATLPPVAPKTTLTTPDAPTTPQPIKPSVMIPPPTTKPVAKDAAAGRIALSESPNDLPKYMTGYKTPDERALYFDTLFADATPDDLSKAEAQAKLIKDPKLKAEVELAIKVRRAQLPGGELYGKATPESVAQYRHFVGPQEKDLGKLEHSLFPGSTKVKASLAKYGITPQDLETWRKTGVPPAGYSKMRADFEAGKDKTTTAEPAMALPLLQQYDIAVWTDRAAVHACPKEEADAHISEAKQQTNATSAKLVRINEAYTSEVSWELEHHTRPKRIAAEATLAKVKADPKSTPAQISAAEADVKLWKERETTQTFAAKDANKNMFTFYKDQKSTSAKEKAAGYATETADILATEGKEKADKLPAVDKADPTKVPAETGEAIVYVKKARELDPDWKKKPAIVQKQEGVLEKTTDTYRTFRTNIKEKADAGTPTPLPPTFKTDMGDSYLMLDGTYSAEKAQLDADLKSGKIDQSAYDARLKELAPKARALDIEIDTVLAKGGTIEAQKKKDKATVDKWEAEQANQKARAADINTKADAELAALQKTYDDAVKALKEPVEVDGKGAKTIKSMQAQDVANAKKAIEDHKKKRDDDLAAINPRFKLERHYDDQIKQKKAGLKEADPAKAKDLNIEIERLELEKKAALKPFDDEKKKYEKLKAGVPPTPSGALEGEEGDAFLAAYKKEKGLAPGVRVGDYESAYVDQKEKTLSWHKTYQGTFAPTSGDQLAQQADDIAFKTDLKRLDGDEDAWATASDTMDPSWDYKKYTKTKLACGVGLGPEAREKGLDLDFGRQVKELELKYEALPVEEKAKHAKTVGLTLVKVASVDGPFTAYGYGKKGGDYLTKAKAYYDDLLKAEPKDAKWAADCKELARSLGQAAIASFSNHFGKTDAWPYTDDDVKAYVDSVTAVLDLPGNEDLKKKWEATYAPLLDDKGCDALLKAHKDELDLAAKYASAEGAVLIDDNYDFVSDNGGIVVGGFFGFLGKAVSGESDITKKKAKITTLTAQAKVDADAAMADFKKLPLKDRVRYVLVLRSSDVTHDGRVAAFTKVLGSKEKAEKAAALWESTNPGQIFKYGGGASMGEAAKKAEAEKATYVPKGAAGVAKEVDIEKDRKASNEAYFAQAYVQVAKLIVDNVALGLITMGAGSVATFGKGMYGSLQLYAEAGQLVRLAKVVDFGIKWGSATGRFLGATGTFLGRPLAALSKGLSEVEVALGSVRGLATAFRFGRGFVHFKVIGALPHMANSVSEHFFGKHSALSWLTNAGGQLAMFGMGGPAKGGTILEFSGFGIAQTLGEQWLQTQYDLSTPEGQKAFEHAREYMALGFEVLQVGVGQARHWSQGKAAAKGEAEQISEYCEKKGIKLPEGFSKDLTTTLGEYYQALQSNGGKLPAEAHLSYRKKLVELAGSDPAAKKAVSEYIDAQQLPLAAEGIKLPHDEAQIDKMAAELVAMGAAESLAAGKAAAKAHLEAKAIETAHKNLEGKTPAGPYSEALAKELVALGYGKEAAKELALTAYGNAYAAQFLQTNPALVASVGMEHLPAAAEAIAKTSRELEANPPVTPEKVKAAAAALAKALAGVPGAEKIVARFNHEQAKALALTTVAKEGGTPAEQTKRYLAAYEANLKTIDPSAPHDALVAQAKQEQALLLAGPKLAEAKGNLVKERAAIEQAAKDVGYSEADAKTLGAKYAEKKAEALSNTIGATVGIAETPAAACEAVRELESKEPLTIADVSAQAAKLGEPIAAAFKEAYARKLAGAEAQKHTAPGKQGEVYLDHYRKNLTALGVPSKEIDARVDAETLFLASRLGGKTIAAHQGDLKAQHAAVEKAASELGRDPATAKRAADAFVKGQAERETMAEMQKELLEGKLTIKDDATMQKELTARTAKKLEAAGYKELAKEVLETKLVESKPLETKTVETTTLPTKTVETPKLTPLAAAVASVPEGPNKAAIIADLERLAKSPEVLRLPEATQRHALESLARHHDPSARAQLEAIITSEAFAALSPETQAKILNLAGGTNTQISGLARFPIARLFQEHTVSKTPIEPRLTELLTEQPWLQGVNFCAEGTFDGRRPNEVVRVSAKIVSGVKFEDGTVADAYVHVVKVAGKEIQIIIPKEPAAPGEHFPTLEQIEKSLAALPASMLATMTTVRVNPKRSAVDAHWEKELNKPGFRAVATFDAQHATMNFFPSPSAVGQARVDGIVFHEAGHGISIEHFGPNSKGPGWDPWRDAITRDKQVASQYAKVNPEEDFSESMALYFEVRGTAHEKEVRALMPHRFAMLDAMFPKDGSLAKPASTLGPSTLQVKTVEDYQALSAAHARFPKDNELAHAYFAAKRRAGNDPAYADKLAAMPQNAALALRVYTYGGEAARPLIDRYLGPPSNLPALRTLDVVLLTAAEISDPAARARIDPPLAEAFATGYGHGMKATEARMLIDYLAHLPQGQYAEWRTRFDAAKTPSERAELFHEIEEQAQSGATLPPPPPESIPDTIPMAPAIPMATPTTAPALVTQMHTTHDNPKTPPQAKEAAALGLTLTGGGVIVERCEANVVHTSEARFIVGDVNAAKKADPSHPVTVLVMKNVPAKEREALEKSGVYIVETIAEATEIARAKAADRLPVVAGKSASKSLRQELAAEMKGAKDSTGTLAAIEEAIPRLHAAGLAGEDSPLAKALAKPGKSLEEKAALLRALAKCHTREAAEREIKRYLGEPVTAPPPPVFAAKPPPSKEVLIAQAAEAGALAKGGFKLAAPKPGEIMASDGSAMPPEPAGMVTINGEAQLVMAIEPVSGLGNKLAALVGQGKVRVKVLDHDGTLRMVDVPAKSVIDFSKGKIAEAKVMRVDTSGTEAGVRTRLVMVDGVEHALVYDHAGGWRFTEASEFKVVVAGNVAVNVSHKLAATCDAAREKLSPAEREVWDRLIFSARSPEEQLMFMRVFAASGLKDALLYRDLVSAYFKARGKEPTPAEILSLGTADGIVQYYDNSCALTSIQYMHAQLSPLEAFRYVLMGREGVIAEQKSGLETYEGGKDSKPTVGKGVLPVIGGGGVIFTTMPNAPGVAPGKTFGLPPAAIVHQMNTTLGKKLGVEYTFFHGTPTRVLERLTTQLSPPPPEGVLISINRGGQSHAVLAVGVYEGVDKNGAPTKRYLIRDPDPYRKGVLDVTEAELLPQLKGIVVRSETHKTPVALGAAVSAHFELPKAEPILLKSREKDGSEASWICLGPKTKDGKTVYELESTTGDKFTVSAAELQQGKTPHGELVAMEAPHASPLGSAKSPPDPKVAKSVADSMGPFAPKDTSYENLVKPETRASLEASLATMEKDALELQIEPKNESTKDKTARYELQDTLKKDIDRVRKALAALTELALYDALLTAGRSPVLGERYGKGKGESADSGDVDAATPNVQFEVADKNLDGVKAKFGQIKKYEPGAAGNLGGRKVAVFAPKLSGEEIPYMRVQLGLRGVRLATTTKGAVALERKLSDLREQEKSGTTKAPAADDLAPLPHDAAWKAFEKTPQKAEADKLAAGLHATFAPHEEALRAKDRYSLFDSSHGDPIVWVVQKTYTSGGGERLAKIMAKLPTAEAKLELLERLAAAETRGDIDAVLASY